MTGHDFKVGLGFGSGYSLLLKKSIFVDYTGFETETRDNDLPSIPQVKVNGFDFK